MINKTTTLEMPSEADRLQLGQIRLETNNATHIQQLVLALIDRGFEVDTIWQEDGCYISIFWVDEIVEGKK